MNKYQDDPDEDQANDNDEYSTRDEPVVKSFYDKYGFDERDGPPDEEETEKVNELWGKSDPRRW